MKDCFSNPPKLSGNYNISIRGVRTLMPIFWEFRVDQGWKIPSHWFNDFSSREVKELKEGDAVWFDTDVSIN